MPVLLVGVGALLAGPGLATAAADVSSTPGQGTPLGPAASDPGTDPPGPTGTPAATAATTATDDPSAPTGEPTATDPATATASPDPSLTPTPTRTQPTQASPSGTAPTTQPPTSAAPTGSPTDETGSPSPAEPSQSATAPAPPPPRSPATPAVTRTDVTMPSLLLAVVALLVAAVVVFAVARIKPPAPPPAVLRESGPEPVTPLLVGLGEAMVDSGYSVSATQATLLRVAEAYGATGAEVIALPTAVLVSVPGQEAVQTQVATAGVYALRLDQVDAVAGIVRRAERGRIEPAEALQDLHEVRDTPPPSSPAVRTIGYVVLSIGLALVLRAGALELVVAGALGAVVGALQLSAVRLSAAARAALPVVVAFGVSVTVFLLARTNLDIGVFAPLVAPLVTFLPGALLTTSVLELAMGQLLSGAGRLAGGAMQLALLALGIVSAAQLVGVPTTEIGSEAAVPLGDVAPWIGVALFGVGVVVHHCAPRRSLPWMLLVLYVAYGAQVLGGLFLGGVLSAFVGALAMTPVAAFVATQPTGPSTQVSFLPAFWLLVPGALSLIGLTQLVGPDYADGLSSLVTTGATMIGIAFGVLIGVTMGDALTARMRTRGHAAGG